MQDDAELTREEAEAALAGWLGRPVSLLVASRRNGLKCEKRGNNLYFRADELRAWANSRQFGKAVRLDIRGTALGDWLYSQRKTMWSFACELQIPEAAVAALCGRERKKLRRLPAPDILLLISLETDIPVEALTADALHAMPPAFAGSKAAE